MADDQTLAELIKRVRAGDQNAAAELVRIYEPAIRRAIHVQMRDKRLRRHFDSMDVCQSVLASFFVRAALGHYQLDQPDQLIKLLATMARRKFINQVRHLTAQRRDHRRAEGIDADHCAIRAPDETPSKIVAGEEIMRRCRELLTPEELQLVELRSSGLSWTEIARHQGEKPDALRMKLARAVNRVSKQLGLEGVKEEGC